MSAVTEDRSGATYAAAYASYTDPAFRAEFMADMERESPIAGRAPSGSFVLRYDPAEFDFRELVCEALVADGRLGETGAAACRTRLEELHQHLRPADQVMDASQQCAAARSLYAMPARFEALYERFVTQVVAAQLSLGPLYYQNVPTFRVFCPEAPGYPGPTSYHNDIAIGHNPREVNVFIPLVGCEGTRSLLLAELDDSLAVLREYQFDHDRFCRSAQQDPALQARCAAITRPLELEVGDVVVFDSRCVHAGPRNTTSRTRVTFDTRVLPSRDLAGQRNSYRGFGRRRAGFVPGDYFSSHTVGAD